MNGTIIKTDFKDTKSAFYSLVDLCKRYGLDVETDSASTTASYYISATLGDWEKTAEIRISDHTKPMDKTDLIWYKGDTILKITNDWFEAEVLSESDFKTVYESLEKFLAE